VRLGLGVGPALADAEGSVEPEADDVGAAVAVGDEVAGTVSVGVAVSSGG